MLYRKRLITTEREALAGVVTLEEVLKGNAEALQSFSDALETNYDC